MNFRQKLSRFKVVKLLTSVKLTVFFLLLLFILTFWGTVAQIYNGLYLSQQRFFESLVFLAMGFLPFPGGQLVMWGLFFNLVCVALVRLNYKWRNSGIIVIHYGLLLFLVAGFVTLHGASETHLTLAEGKASNVSASYHDWEISFWEKSPVVSPGGKIVRNVHAVNFSKIENGEKIDIKELGFHIEIKELFRNCQAYQDTNASSDAPLNASSIRVLKPKLTEKEPEKNNPGVIFKVQAKEGRELSVLLFGNETLPTSFKNDGREFEAILRLAKEPLPFILRLNDFVEDKHPGTEMARSYKSEVSVETKGVWRDKTISMNNPLRYNDFTVYQASFARTQMGQELSTLAVVKNSGRVLPYIATFMTFAGLALHFIMMALNSKKKMESPYVHQK